MSILPKERTVSVVSFSMSSTIERSEKATLARQAPPGPPPVWPCCGRSIRPQLPRRENDVRSRRRCLFRHQSR
jgi:hypothetical protein